jgi:hypothetical protein
MFVVFIHGLPASGKYTIGKIVAEKLGIPFFHNHLTVDLVGSLFAFGTPEFIKMREKIWIDCFQSAAESGESFVFTFNPESTVAAATLDKMEFAIRGSAGSIVYVELECDIEEIENRIGNSDRSEFGKLTDLEMFKKLKNDGVFDSPVMPEPAIIVDAGKNSPEISAESIVDDLKRLGFE